MLQLAGRGHEPTKLEKSLSLSLSLSLSHTHTHTKRLGKAPIARAASRAASAVAVVAAFASLLTFVPAPAGARSGGLEVELPPNTDCRGAAVIAKVTVVEDAAAANMLAEALNDRAGGNQRCLLDAGLPGGGVLPTAAARSSAGLASDVYVVGGPAAIPDAWLVERLGITGFTRVAGADRWATQANVASAIVALAVGDSVQSYDPVGAAAATRELPPNGHCHGTAVLAKLRVAEERAAANMLAAALTLISGDPKSRCLIDVGDPGDDAPPTAVAAARARQAAGVYVLGGTVVVPDAWIEKGFDIRFLERLSGPDRWATQSAVARKIMGISVGATLPHQHYSDDGKLISVHGHQVINETDFDRANFLSSGPHRMKVHYCASERFLQGNGGTFAKAAAAGYLADEVAQLNTTVAGFIRHQSGGALLLEFVKGDIIELPHDEVKWSQSLFGSDSAAAQECVDEAREQGPGYVLIDQPLGGNALGFAYLGGLHLAVQPIRARFAVTPANSGQFETTFAHEVGHAWLGLCHPHDSQRVWCRDGHDQWAFEADLEAAYIANGSQGRYTTDQVQLCSLMSYCYEVGGYLTDYTTESGGPVWIACGQRELLGWPDGPATPHGECVDGQLVPSYSDSKTIDDDAWQPIVDHEIRWDSNGEPYVVFSWHKFRHNEKSRDYILCPPGAILADGPIYQAQTVRVKRALLDEDGPWTDLWKPSSISIRSHHIKGHFEIRHHHLEAGKEYKFRIKTRCEIQSARDRHFEDSEDIEFKTPKSKPPEPARAPGAPRLLSLTPLDGGISVKWWTALSNGARVTHYQVDWGSNSKEVSASNGIFGLSNLAESYLIQNISKGTPYSVRVRARNSEGWGPWSDSEMITVGRIESPPDAPRGLAVLAGDGEITVSWGASPTNGSPVTGYTVGWTGGGVSDSRQVGASARRYTITGLSNDTRYTVKVTAHSGAGRSPSAARQATPQRQASVPDAPGRPSLRDDGGGVLVSWSAPASNGASINRYEVRHRRSGSSWNRSDGDGSWVRFRITGTAAGTVYEAQVRARNREGWGPWSSTGSVTTKAATPRASVSISEGPVNSRRTNAGSCGSGKSCHDLRYTIDGLGGGPYTLECWFNGQRAWRGTWSGRATWGCYYGSTYRGSIHVVIDGVQSNTVTVR